MSEHDWSAWARDGAAGIAERVGRDMAALVGVSSPSGDREAAEEVVAVAAALLPDGATLERLPCSSPGFADDLLARLEGSGTGKLLLLGHLDTVVSHESHHPIRHEGDLAYGPGTIDMKGGVAISLGLFRLLAERRGDFAEASLLLVVDEEWRRHPFAHAARFSGHDACLCFEGGELTDAGEDAVIVRRKAAGTVHVAAEGVAAHSGANPELGRNALTALVHVATVATALNDPDGGDRLTVVPTILRCGDAFNVIPGAGELYIDTRADSIEAITTVAGKLPREHEGVRLEVELARGWPGMDMRERAAGPLARAAEMLGRPIVAGERGGASDASHLAAGAPLLAIDGLGPLGGGSHAPDEHVVSSSLRSRSEVALALAAAVLSGE